MPIYDAAATRGTVGLHADWVATVGTVAAEMYDLTCDISRATRTTDNTGGRTTSRANVATAVPCMIVVNPSGTVTEGGRLTTEAVWTIAVEQAALTTAGVTLQREDQIVIGSDTYEVEDTNQEASHRSEVWAYCRKA